jgi:hypothetical protein
MLTFWGYYVDPLVGKSIGFFILFASVLISVAVLAQRRLDRQLLMSLAAPFGLWALGCLFILFLGFAHGGTDSPLATAAVRFTGGALPSDNDIPHFFTDWFYLHGRNGPPPLFPGEWHFSDRPPLQVAYMLMQRPIAWDASLMDYQLIGVALQQLWIVAVWALLSAWRVGRATKALILIVILVSPVALVNGFFVWPKLLPAAMLIAAAALVASPLWAEVRASRWAPALTFTLLGLALLGHGASIFGVVPIALVAAIRGLPSWRWVGVGLVAAFLLYLPWMAYQHFEDPPGDRLNKWMLAGVDQIDDRGTFETLQDSYGAVGIGGAIHNKVENGITMIGGGPMASHLESAATELEDGDSAGMLKELRTVLFFYFLPSLGLLVVAPLAQVLGRLWRRGPPTGDEWSFTVTTWLIVLVGCAFWGLALFGSEMGRTLLHQGSLALPILAFVASVSGLRALWPRAAVAYCLMAAAVSLAVHVPMLAPEPSSAFSVTGLLFAGLSLAAFCALTMVAGRPRTKLSRVRLPGAESSLTSGVSGST